MGHDSAKMGDIEKQSLIEETQRILDELLTPKEQKEIRKDLEEEIDKRLDLFFIDKCFYMLNKLQLMQNEISYMVELFKKQIEKHQEREW